MNKNSTASLIMYNILQVNTLGIVRLSTLLDIFAFYFLLMTDSFPQRLKPYLIEKSVLVKSPSRINLIGEHTDYNEGFVLPAAIDKAAYIVLNKRTDNRIVLHSADWEQRFEIELQDLAPQSQPSWPNYLLGVVAQFQKAGFALSGFEAALSSDVPVGAGLSSSAAIECAMAMALSTAFEHPLSRIDLVKLSQKAEHEYAGVKCGIMDQFASGFGKKDHVIKLDCKSLEYEYKPLQLNGYKIVLFDTNVKHSLASSEYNVRREQCETGVAWVQEVYPEVRSLRDISLDQLKQLVLPKDALIYQRCKFVVEENIRLLSGCDDLETGNIEAFGKKMFRTHEGLSKEYEVSCPELDFLVEAVKNHPHVLGSRMMGGGFGGCTINIIKEEGVHEIVNTLSESYQKQMQKALTVHHVSIENGTTLLS